MASTGSGFVTCLWFDGRAEEAANYYLSIFPNSLITNTMRYPPSSNPSTSTSEPGAVMSIEFSLNGHKFVGLNGGPHFQFSEAISFMVDCKDQEEVDWYWEKLGEGREGRCGWIKDRFGVSWQVIPKQLKQFLSSGDGEKSKKCMEKMRTMGKMDIEGLRKAFEGVEE
ncbi:DNA-binding protein [Clohesyomyces aquaticus]|uniref:DNA-binding protein n=1 Tax=Clohesyomyces aquaticus TaxID=1231657 RepID=A0A1Y2A3R5_9PLEO|nr:DNA-binding protein [Clohesyomyces aquaticus]